MQVGDSGPRPSATTPAPAPAGTSGVTAPVPSPSASPVTDRTDFQTASPTGPTLLPPNPSPAAPAAPVLLTRLPQGVSGLMTCRSPFNGESVPGTLISRAPINPEGALDRTSMQDGDRLFIPDHQDEVACAQDSLVETPGGHAYIRHDRWTEHQKVGQRTGIREPLSTDPVAPPETVVTHELATRGPTVNEGIKKARTADVAQTVLARGGEAAAISAIPGGRVVGLAVGTVDGALDRKHPEGGRKDPLAVVDRAFDRGAKAVVDALYGHVASPRHVAKKLAREQAAAARATDVPATKP